mgnify:CR=1 FL=1
MDWLNYHHLLYFWTVAREGSIARACEKLRLAQPTISGQLRQLEDVLGEAVPDFCYPYGDYSLRARDLVQEAGYRTATTCIRGAANLSDNPFELTRKAISYGDNLVGFAFKLHAKQARKGQAALPDRIPS